MPSNGAPLRFQTATLREIHSPSDFPVGRCFIIQFFERRNIHHEGDERSRSNPGHGYPAHTEVVHSTTQFVTTDEVEWRSKITELFQTDKNRTDIAAFMVESTANIQTTVEVKLR